MIPMVPVNNKKGFHGIPWNWHQQFHGIPWNLECANFADTSSSMEFHGIPWNLEYANFNDTSSSMELGERQEAQILKFNAPPLHT